MLSFYFSSTTQKHLDLEVKWPSDLYTRLEIGIKGVPLPIELHDLQFSATLRVKLAPWVPELNPLGGVQLTFVNKPHVRAGKEKKRKRKDRRSLFRFFYSFSTMVDWLSGAFVSFRFISFLLLSFLFQVHFGFSIAGADAMNARVPGMQVATQVKDLISGILEGLMVYPTHLLVYDNMGGVNMAFLKPIVGIAPTF